MTSVWAKVQLAEVIAERKEVPSADDLATGKVRIVAKVGFNDGRIQLRVDGLTKTGMILIRPGDLILSGINAAKGAIAVYGEDNTEPVAATIHYGAYIPNKARVDVSYLWWLLRSCAFRDLLLQYVPGGIKTELKAKRLLPIPIPLPPLSEQQRIVARIEELASKIEEARGLRLRAVEEANAFLKGMARRLLAEVDAPTSELRAWLDHNGDGIQTGPFGAQLGATDFVESGIPVITIGNVQYGGLQLDNLRYVSKEKARQLDRYRIKAGDILFARMGTVGRCCIVPREAECWLINYHIIRVALDKLRIEPRYIHWSIRASGEVVEYLDKTIRGATRQGVNSAIVGAIPCRVPPVNEQRRIVARLDDLQAKVDALKRLQAETAVAIDAMLPSILDKAFKGELRIADGLQKALSLISSD